MAGKEVAPLPQLHLQSLLVACPSADPWQFSDDEPENDGAAPEELVMVDPFVVEASTGAQAEVKAMKDFQEKQRGRAANFFDSAPAHRLLVSLVCLGVAVSFLHAVEAVSGSSWDMATWARCVQGGEYRSRMMAAAGGGIQAGAFAKASDIIFCCRQLVWLASFGSNVWLCGSCLLHGIDVSLRYRPDVATLLAHMALPDFFAFGQTLSKRDCNRIS